MDNQHGPQEPGRIQYFGITDIRKAACLMVLGFRPVEKGICRVYDAAHPKSSGGIAHFYFDPNQAAEIQSLLAVYDAGKANAELDELLDANQINPEIQGKIRDAVMVWMREAIDSFWNISFFIRHQATELVLTGGEAAHDDEGNMIGKQGFKLKVVNPKK